MRGGTHGQHSTLSIPKRAEMHVIDGISALCIDVNDGQYTLNKIFPLRHWTYIIMPQNQRITFLGPFNDIINTIMFIINMI